MHRIALLLVAAILITSFARSGFVVVPVAVVLAVIAAVGGLSWRALAHRDRVPVWAAITGIVTAGAIIGTVFAFPGIAVDLAVAGSIAFACSTLVRPSAERGTLAMAWLQLPSSRALVAASLVRVVIAVTVIRQAFVFATMHDEGTTHPYSYIVDVGGMLSRQFGDTLVAGNLTFGLGMFVIVAGILATTTLRAVRELRDDTRVDIAARRLLVVDTIIALLIAPVIIGGATWIAMHVGGWSLSEVLPAISTVAIGTALALLMTTTVTALGMRRERSLPAAS